VSDVIQEIEWASQLKAKRLSRDIWPLSGNDWVSGEDVEVEFLGQNKAVQVQWRRTKKKAGVRAVPVEDLWDRSAVELETSEYGGELAGAKITVWQLENRDPLVRGRFPGETEWVQILECIGAEIQRNIDEMVGVHCEVQVIERGARPCYEDLALDEIYEDVGLKITATAPLPEVIPADHTMTRRPSYQQRRAGDAWLKLKKERAERMAEYFRDEEHSQRSEIRIFWEELRCEENRVQREWVEDELPRVAPEEVVPQDLERTIKKKVSDSIDLKAAAHSEEVSEIQPCISKKGFSRAGG
jgi:hypothetical protein